MGTGLSNYTINYANGQLAVSPKPLTVTANSTSKTYGQTVTFAGTQFTTGGLVNGDTVTSVMLTSSGATATATVAGSPYPIVPSAAVGTGLGNYTISYANGQLAVSPKALTVTANSSSKTYGQALTFAGTEFTASGLVNSDMVTGATLMSSGAAATATVVGSPYPIVPSDAVGTGLSNYTINYANGQLVVSPKALTVTAMGVNRVYDGTTAATATLLDNRVSGDVLTDSYSTATFADKGVGTAKPVTVSGVSISGTDAGNYQLASGTASATANITARPLTVTATGVNKVYDGTTAATVAFLDNRVPGDIVTDSYPAAAFGDKNVGTGKLVSVSGISISGTDAGNYQLASGTASTTANITARTLAVTATGVNRVYDGTTAATVAFLDNRVPGDVFTDSYTAAAFGDKNVGTGKPVSVSGISISGTDAGNYQSASRTASTTANITALQITVTAVSVTKTYDGNTSVPVAAVPTVTPGLAPGDTPNFAETYDIKNVGTGNKTLTPYGSVIDGNSDNNYSVTFVSNTTGTITTRLLTLTATAANKLYDGTTQATVVAWGDNRVSGDILTETCSSATFADPNVGMNKPVTIHGVSISGPDALNYQLASTTVTTTADIFLNPIGPVTSDVTATPNPTNTAPKITALEDDSNTGNTKVTAAEYFIDNPGNDGKGIPMKASDGKFNSLTENVVATLSPTTFKRLADGPHEIYVHGKDATGKWGILVSTTFTKDTVGPVTSNVTVLPNPASTAPTVTATVSDAMTGNSNVVAVEYFIDKSGTAGKGTAIPVPSPSPSVSVSAVLSLTAFGKLKLGNHKIYVHGKDAAGNWGKLVSVAFTKGAQAVASASPAAATNGVTAGPPASSAAAAFALRMSLGTAQGTGSPAGSLVGDTGVADMAGGSSPQSKKAQLATIDRLMLTSADWL